MWELLHVAAAGPTILYVVALLAGTVGRVIRRWIAHRTAIDREAETTRRLALIVRDTESRDRAAIVRAYGSVAGK